MPRRALSRAIASDARVVSRPVPTPTVTARIAAFVLSFVLATPLVTPAPAVEPIELVGALPITIPAAGGLVTNVWGWVHPTTHREYAIVGTRPRGIHIVDVTDPTNPILIGYVDNVTGFDMKTWGTYLYVCDGGGGITTRILDIADPTNPVILPAMLPSAHSIAISNAGMMWLNYPGLRGLNLATNPTAPTVWFAGPAGGHDTTCRGNWVYDYSGYGGCRIYNLSAPLTLSLIGTCYDARIRYYHSGDRSKDGKTLYICDEFAIKPSPDITIWDITAPATPQMLATSISDSTATAHNLFIVGDVAYVSYYTAGFKAFNIADPVHPSLIGAYDTAPAQTGECYCGGAYGVYPFAPSGVIYVSDWNNGLFLFRLTTTTAVRFTDITAEPARDGVVVKWDVWTDEAIAGFRVYRRDEGGTLDLPLGAAPLSARARAFLDGQAAPGHRYSYIVVALTDDGDQEMSPRVMVTVPAGTTRVVSVHPNPFNPRTTVEYELAETAYVTLDVFDTNGARVARLVDGTRSAGEHSASWEGLDGSGQPVASGVYFARLTVDKRAFTRQMVLLK